MEDSMRFMYNNITIFSVALLLVFSFANLLAAEVSPKRKKMVAKMIEQVEDLRNDLRSQKGDEHFNKVLQKAEHIAEKFIDFTEVSALSLGEHYKKMTATQQEHFVKSFRTFLASQIIRNSAEQENQTYLKKEIPYEILSEEETKDTLWKKDAVVIKTFVKGERLNFDIDLWLHHDKKDKNRLKVYDIYVDGSSFILDYRNQFSRIIKEKGIDYLLSLFDKKIAELRAQVK